jgi:molybdate transport system substrate-binding protein
MMKCSFSHPPSFVSVLVAALATVMATPIPARAQLRVIISGGFSTAYRQVLPEFERSTGITVTTLSGSSQERGRKPSPPS